MIYKPFKLAGTFFIEVLDAGTASSIQSQRI